MIQTIPDSTWRAMRSPLARSRVQIEAPRPKFESFARSSASSSESTTTIGTTGPKISSRMIRISSVTPPSTVGAMNFPLKPGHLARTAGEPLGAGGDRVVDQRA